MEHSNGLSCKEANELLIGLHQLQQAFYFTKSHLRTTSCDAVQQHLKKICKDTAHLLNCDRVEIWMFNQDQTKLTTDVAYDRREVSVISEKNLYKNKTPAYFASIIDQRTLAVDNTATHPAMKDIFESLSTTYEQTQSMLDASIVLSWGVGGVICCLSEKKRQWTPLHCHIIASIADMAAFIYDRQHRQDAEEQLYKLAFTDTYTGLYNQNGLIDIVTNHLKQTSSSEGTFVYVTLDQYTKFRNVLGHDNAKRTLKTVAARFRKLLPNSAVIARIAFDHFAIFIPFKLYNKDAEIFTKQVNEQLNSPMQINEQEVYITFSYGVAYYPEHVSDVKEGLQAAQVALENIKQTKNREARAIYQPEMHAFLKDSLVSEMNLRKGLDLHEFQLFYQPQVQCETGELIGFEALIRWQHPERGLIFPGAFIDIAESTGLIEQIGEWVIQEAFSQLKRWRNEGRGDVTLSINISPRHFLKGPLPAYLLNCAKEANVSPKQLMIEITEYVALENWKDVEQRMLVLRKMGFPIAIDDFGTGYSAFDYLQHYPIQQIKIDRQFIKNITKNQRSESIVNMIIQLGKALGLRTIAEGVETIDEWKMLKQMNCDEIQGFYFSKPLPISEISDIFKQSKSSKEIILPV